MQAELNTNCQINTKKTSIVIQVIDDSNNFHQIHHKLSEKFLWLKVFKNNVQSIGCKCYKSETKQDGPSLESSSYLNVSLRYLGPWDPWTSGPLDLGTLGPLPSSNTSSYFPIHLLTLFKYSHFWKVIILAIFIQSFNILPKV